MNKKDLLLLKIGLLKIKSKETDKKVIKPLDELIDMVSQEMEEKEEWAITVFCKTDFWK